jgi:predicted esterase
LPSSYSYEFPDGDEEVSAAPELAGVYQGPFYSFGRFPTDSATREAQDYVKEYMEDEGPFDAVLGFSHGAGLAASLILRHQHEHPFEQPLFKTAVFICTFLPVSRDLDLALKSDATEKIDIPTVHIVGGKDTLHSHGIKLMQACDKTLAKFYDHQMGHEIPRTPACKAGIKNAIEWAVTMGETGRAG